MSAAFEDQWGPSPPGMESAGQGPHGNLLRHHRASLRPRETRTQLLRCTVSVACMTKWSGKYYIRHLLGDLWLTKQLQ